MDAAQHLRLTALPPDESATLLTRLDTTGRMLQDQHVCQQLAELCGHLPLAPRIMAARMTSRPDWPLSTFVERLANEQHRLDHLDHKDRSVRACFRASYQAPSRGDFTDRSAAYAFRLLGLPDGPDVSLPIAARLLDRPEPATESILDRLVDAQLLDNGVPGRYGMHDLLRLYARELAEETPVAERHAALTRSWRCCLATVARASQLLRPGQRKNLVEINASEALPLEDHRHARAWLEAESENLLAAGRQAIRMPGEMPKIAVGLAHALFAFMHVNAHWIDLRDLNLQALGVAKPTGDRTAEAQVLSDLCVTAWRSGNGDEAVRLFQEAIATLERALAIHLKRASAVEAIWDMALLGEAHRRAGDVQEAITRCEEALAQGRRIGTPYEQGLALWRLGSSLADLGDLDRATTHWLEALPIFEHLGARETVEIQRLLALWDDRVGLVGRSSGDQGGSGTAVSGSCGSRRSGLDARGYHAS